MKNNSNNTSLNSQKVDDTMRSLIMNYINATNKGDHAAAEVILHEINTMRKLTDDR